MAKKPARKGFQMGGLIRPPGGMTRLPRKGDEGNTPVARGAGAGRGGFAKGGKVQRKSTEEKSRGGGERWGK
jgi:hypothetical protein